MSNVAIFVKIDNCKEAYRRDGVTMLKVDSFFARIPVRIISGLRCVGCCMLNGVFGAGLQGPRQGRS